MGTFSVMVSVGNPSGGDQVAIEALVDTGASDSMFPASLLEHLHLEPGLRLTTHWPMEPK